MFYCFLVRCSPNGCLCIYWMSVSLHCLRSFEQLHSACRGTHYSFVNEWKWRQKRNHKQFLLVATRPVLYCWFTGTCGGSMAGTAMSPVPSVRVWVLMDKQKRWKKKEEKNLVLFAPICGQYHAYCFCSILQATIAQIVFCIIQVVFVLYSVFCPIFQVSITQMTST